MKCLTVDMKLHICDATMGAEEILPREGLGWDFLNFPPWSISRCGRLHGVLVQETMISVWCSLVVLVLFAFYLHTPQYLVTLVPSWVMLLTQSVVSSAS